MCDVCAFEQFITLNRSLHSPKIKEKQTLRKQCNDKKIEEFQHLFIFVHYTVCKESKYKEKTLSLTYIFVCRLSLCQVLQLK